MSRIRSIKPDAFRSLNLATVPIPARWLFAGLWCEADDEGRLHDHPALLRSQVFPVDEDVEVKDVRGWLDALVGIGSLCRYSVDGRDFLHVPAWRDHQVINRPTPSRIPACPHHPESPRSAPGGPRGRRGGQSVEDRARALLEEPVEAGSPSWETVP